MIKNETITQNRDFKRAYTRGRFVASPLLVTYAVKNRFNCIRVGISSSKKTGNAVCRNRSKRVIREAFRIIKNDLNTGFDIVFVTRSKTSLVKMQRVLFDMKKQLSRLNLLIKK